MDPDRAFHFDTDPDPAFQFDKDPDPTVWYGSGSLPFPRGSGLKTVLTYTSYLDFFPLSVGPTGSNQKAYLVKFSLPVNFIVLIRVAYWSGSYNTRECIQITENASDPYRSRSATLRRRRRIRNWNLKIDWTDQGSTYISVRKQYLFPPLPSENYICPPLARHHFLLLSWPFCLKSYLFCIYSTLLLTLFSFSYSFFLFLSPFFLFLLLSPLFLFPFSYFFPQMTSSDTPPGRGTLSSTVYRPLERIQFWNNGKKSPK